MPGYTGCLQSIVALPGLIEKLRVKDLTSTPVAVITNGSLLHQESVRDDLLAADAVLPTLDAGSDSLYRVINRPSATPPYELYVQGLRSFRRVYAGLLWIEVMLVKGLNDSPEALQELTTILELIGPDEVHISLPIRPPAERWVETADPLACTRAAEMLGARRLPPVRDPVDLSDHDSLSDVIVRIVARHPMREDELRRSLGGRAPSEVSEALSSLLVAGQVQVVDRLGQLFWCSGAGHHADRSPRGAVREQPAPRQ